MSDHKRCRACGRIEETTLRLECEARIRPIIEHWDRMARLRAANRAMDEYEESKS